MTDEIMAGMARYFKLKAAAEAIQDDAVECPRCGGSGMSDAPVLYKLFFPWCFFERCLGCEGYGSVSPETGNMLEEWRNKKAEEQRVVSSARAKRAQIKIRADAGHGKKAWTEYK